MPLELSNWFWEGVLMKGGVLANDRAYVNITGWRERWLYRVARKHAGGAGEALAHLRDVCPGWDYQTLPADFKAWIGASSYRTPVNYQAAFVGFVKRHHKKNALTLQISIY